MRGFADFTQEQQTILERWYDLEPGASLVVSAVAGAGKTTVMRQCAKALAGAEKSTLVVVFNKALQHELQPTMPGVAVRTVHSLGRGVLLKSFRHTKLTPGKYTSLAQFWLNEHELPTALSGILADRVTLARNLLTLEREGWEAFAALTQPQAPLDLSVLQAAIPELIGWGIGGHPRHGLGVEAAFDFADMVYIPGSLNLPRFHYPYLLVDEIQDFSRAAGRFVTGLRSELARLIGFGDPAQAIYGFQGADPGAFYALCDSLNAEELPLSTSQRCPPQVCRVAAKFGENGIHSALSLPTPTQPLEDNRASLEPAQLSLITLERERDSFEVVPHQDFLARLEKGNLVLCRNNAPLLRLARTLLSSRQRFSLLGREFAAEAVDGIEGSMRARGRGPSHGLRLSTVRRELEADANRTAGDDGKQALLTMIALIDLALGSEITKLSQLRGFITEHFSTDSAVSADRINLSTVHQAKGLEADGVWLIEPALLSGSEDSHRDLETRNLIYVAVTRAKRKFCLVVADREGSALNEDGFAPPSSGGALGAALSDLSEEIVGLNLLDTTDFRPVNIKAPPLFNLPEPSPLLPPPTEASQLFTPNELALHRDWGRVRVLIHHPRSREYTVIHGGINRRVADVSLSRLETSTVR